MSEYSEITKASIEKYLAEIDCKLPYTKYIGHGLWEVFDGKSSCYMGQELYEQFTTMLQEAGKNLTPKP